MTRTDPVLEPDEVRRGLLSGRAAALATLREWVEGLVFGGRWRLPDPEGAVQEVVTKLFWLAREDRVQEGTDFRSFVLTVARHTCTDLYRRERLRGGIEAPESPAEPPDRRAESPEERLERAERREILRYIVQGLDEGCRQLWSWIYRDGLSQGEIAERLGITPGNLRVRVHRCLKRARALHDSYLPRPKGRRAE
jgi:RNA polymerase sigma-70 factor (ECF subfamily)